MNKSFKEENPTWFLNLFMSICMYIKCSRENREIISVYCWNWSCWGSVWYLLCLLCSPWTRAARWVSCPSRWFRRRRGKSYREPRLPSPASWRPGWRWTLGEEALCSTVCSWCYCLSFSTGDAFVPSFVSRRINSVCCCRPGERVKTLHEGYWGNDIKLRLKTHDPVV